MKTLKTLILTKYEPATDRRGSRIRCQSWKGVTWHNYDYSARSPYEAAAQEHAKEHGFSDLEEVIHNDPEKAFIAKFTP